jgi:hypothetical protein
MLAAAQLCRICLVTAKSSVPPGRPGCLPSCKQAAGSCPGGGPCTTACMDGLHRTAGVMVAASAAARLAVCWQQPGEVAVRWRRAALRPRISRTTVAPWFVLLADSQEGGHHLIASTCRPSSRRGRHFRKVGHRVCCRHCQRACRLCGMHPATLNPHTRSAGLQGVRMARVRSSNSAAAAACRFSPPDVVTTALTWMPRRVKGLSCCGCDPALDVGCCMVHTCHG